jgi:hypothetical protein
MPEAKKAITIDCRKSTSILGKCQFDDFGKLAGDSSNENWLFNAPFP